MTRQGAVYLAWAAFWSWVLLGKPSGVFFREDGTDAGGAR